MVFFASDSIKLVEFTSSEDALDRNLLESEDSSAVIMAIKNFYGRLSKADESSWSVPKAVQSVVGYPLIHHGSGDFLLHSSKPPSKAVRKFSSSRNKVRSRGYLLF